MRYTVIAGTSGCSGGTCPTIYADTHREDEVLVQGYVIDQAEADALGIPAGETAVRIPRSLLNTARGEGGDG